MDKLKIKSKKDWCIAFVFTVLMVYGITRRFSSTLQSWLLTYGNPKLTNMNQPKSYGNFMVTALIMMVLIEIVLFLYHKSFKIKLLTIIAGIACTGFIFAGYLINCNLIVSVIGEEPPSSVHANGWGTGIHIRMDAKQKKQLVSYCEKLQPVSKEREKELEETFYNSDTDVTSNSLLIWITYPKKYGHNYDLMVCVYNDMIFVHKGYDNHNKEVVTFFEDNGLLDLIDESED